MLKIIRFSLLFSLVCTLIMTGCKKTEIENVKVYQDTVISGNIQPPYTGVPAIKIETYINKIYIDLLGREPLDSELTGAASYLQLYTLSDEARDTLIENLFVTREYHNRLFEITSQRMIGGADSAAIAQEVLLEEYIRDSLYAPGGDTLAVHQLEIELDKLYKLQGVKESYKNGSITVNDYYKRFLLNYFYDQINMGSENFSKATFENLFYRLPTGSELSNSIDMVEGSPSSIFLQDGNTKYDFANIVANCSAFYEGLVIQIYETFLLRAPTSTEMGTDATDAKNKGYQYIQKKTLKSKEYAGF